MTTAPASADAPAQPVTGRDTAPGQLKKLADDPPVCPEGQYPNNDGGCSEPVCPDGSAVPESGDCPAGTCPDGSEICETRSCPVDLPLPPGALCEDANVVSTRPPPTPAAITSTASSAEAGGGAAVGPAVQASVFGRPAEVLGVQITAAAAGAPDGLPAVAATGADTTILAILGLACIALGVALVRLGERAPRVQN